MLRNGHLRPVVEKLKRLSTLDDDDIAAIAALPVTVFASTAGTQLIREGDPSDKLYALLEGFAYRARATADGRSQIISFHMPGDMFDIALLLSAVSDSSVVTIGPTRIGAIPMSAIRALKQQRPAIADALWRDTLLDATIHKEWVVNVGQRDAQSRIAHMLSEFLTRRATTIQGARRRHILPLNQSQIAAATGLTPVHVNRMLKLLEERGALRREAGHVVLDDPEALARIGKFAPHYLQPAASSD